MLAASFAFPMVSSEAEDIAEEDRGRQELTSERTETSQTFQNPDGSLTTEISTQAIRFKDDAGKWTKIDTSLVERDGHYEPKASQVEMSFSAGGDTQFVDLKREGGDSIALGWPTQLPEPDVNGNTLTYPNVVPNGDLVVVALPTGFSHSIVLREAPADPDLTIPVPVDLNGTALKETSGGGLSVTSSSDTAVKAPAPLMWDSSIGAFDMPDNTAPVEAAVTKNTDGTTLVLTPDADMLGDPDTEYPVTIDPTFTQDTPTSDTFIQSSGSYTNSNTVRNWSTLRSGYSTDGGGIMARTFLKFPYFDYTDKTVTGAELQVRNVKSNVCTNASTVAERLLGDWSETSLTWPGPSVDTSYSPPQYYLAHGGPSGSGCTDHGWGKWNVTRAVQDWSNGAGNYGLRLRAATENWTNAYKEWRAHEGVTAGTGTTYYPKLAITYLADPSTPEDLKVSPCQFDYCNEEDAPVTSSTPTFTASSSDADTAQVTLNFELWNGSPVTSRHSFGSVSVPSGTTASWTVPQALTPGTYSLRVSGSDGRKSSDWTEWQVLTYAPLGQPEEATPEAEDTSPIEFTGKLVDEAGAPVASQDVALFVDPTEAQVAAVPDSAPEDEGAESTMLEQVTTDDQGNYSFATPTELQVSGYVSADRLVNFSIMADAAANMPIVTLQKRSVGSADTFALEEPTDANLPQSERVQTNSNGGTPPPAVVESGLQEGPVPTAPASTMEGADDATPESYGPSDLSEYAAPAPTTNARVAAAAARPNPGVKKCKTRNYDSPFKAWAQVGAMSIEDPAVNAQLKYTRGATSKLGVAAKISGKWVPGATASGETTTSKSSTGSVTYKRTGKAGPYRWHTQFSYQKKKRICGGEVRHRWAQVKTYDSGGMTTLAAKRPKAKSGSCVPFEKGQQFDLVKTRASEFSAGVELPAVAVSAQTGYSNDLAINVGFSKDRHLCGTKGTPGSSRPGILIGR